MGTEESYLELKQGFSELVTKLKSKASSAKVKTKRKVSNIKSKSIRTVKRLKFWGKPKMIEIPHAKALSEGKEALVKFCEEVVNDIDEGNITMVKMESIREHLRQYEEHFVLDLVIDLLDSHIHAWKNATG